MEIVITIIICILIILAVLIYLINKIKKEEVLQKVTNINEAIKSINIELEKEEKLLEYSINVIKESNKRKYSKKNILDDIIKNKNKKLNIYQKYNELEKNIKEFNSLIEEDKKLEEVKEIKKIIYKLKLIRNDLQASIKFYDNNVDELDKEKPIFTKNIERYKKFNIKKEEEFEILKEGKK